MSTHKETKKGVLINLRITEEMAQAIKDLDINVSETCREALAEEIKWRRNPKSRHQAKKRGEL